ncbi:MAG: serine/threonine-protein kinase [Candidatus Eisenbacteria bacterium]
MRPDDPTQPPDRPEDRSTEAVEPRSVHDPGSIGPYRLLQPIGEGGMGEVWLAQQQHPVRRHVAIKFIKLGMDSKHVIARFEAERQALALMDHPAVARVFEAGTTSRGAPYFVMEYVRGLPITTYCDQHQLAPRARLELFQRVCEGVQHAHQKAIVHRDLKPSNILVTEHDGRAVPKIIDFGLAKAMAQKLTDRTLHTEYGARIGTPEYMSPEQADPTIEDVDTRTDVYSLGVILYELLVGALPFDAQTLRSAGFEGVRRILQEEEPKRPSLRLTSLGEGAAASARARGVEPLALRRQLEGDLDWITLKALEKDRTRRYDSPNELARDVGRYLADEPVLATPPSTAYRVSKFVRRHRGAVLAGAALTLALVAGVIGTTVGLVRARRAEALAREQAASSDRVSRFLASMLEGIDPRRLGRDLQADLEHRVAEAGSLGAVNFVDVSAGLIDRQIFTPARATIDTSLGGDPALAARLETTLGTSYMRGLQLFDPAVAALRRAVALEAHARRPGAARDWNPTMELIMALKRSGGASAFAEAESLCNAVIAGHGARDADDPLVLEAKMQLGDTYRTQRRGAEAESTLRDVLGRMRRAPGVTREMLGYALNGLALVLRDDEATRAESDSLFLESLAIASTLRGPGDYELLNVRLNRARLLLYMERFGEAEGELRRILADGRETIGVESDLALQARVALGDALKGERRWDEAIAVYRDAERAMRRPGNTSRSLGASILNRSEALVATGRAAESIRELEAFADEQGRAGTEIGAYRVQLCLYRIATLHAARGDRDAGLASLRRLAESGFDAPDDLTQDSALAPLHGPAFDAIVAKVRANAARAG